MFLGRNYSELLASNTTREGSKMWRKHTKSSKIDRTGSIWLSLGRYLHRIHPTGSGEPLGCLPGPKTPPKSKNPGFGGLGVRGEASPLFPLFALKGCGQKFNNPMQRLHVGYVWVQSRAGAGPPVDLHTQILRRTRSQCPKWCHGDPFDGKRGSLGIPWGSGPSQHPLRAVGRRAVRGNSDPTAPGVYLPPPLKG